MATFQQILDNPDFPNVKDVDPTLVYANASRVTLVDVREPDEYVGELGHIDGSILIPLVELESQWEKIPKSREIVFICRSGRRSAVASQYAAKMGFQNSFNMLGGMILWNQKNLEVNK